MSDSQVLYKEELIQEIEATPNEYLPLLLQIIRLFREGITLKPADDSFRQGWKEVITGETMPIEDLWVGIE